MDMKYLKLQHLHALEALKYDPVSCSAAFLPPLAACFCTRDHLHPDSLLRTPSRHSAGLPGKGIVEDEESLLTLCPQGRQYRRTKEPWQKRKYCIS